MQFHHTVLDNGLRVIAELNDQAHSVASGFFVKTGSRDEAAEVADFGPHPLGQSILGSVESIGAMKVEQMRDYFARRYSPANIVLAFAGKTDWDHVVALAEARCGGWRGGEPTRVAVVPKG